MKQIIFAMAFLTGLSASAKDKNYYRVVTGKDVFQEQHLNQFDDSDPRQAYLVKLPRGYSLTSANVTAEWAVCGVSSFDNNKQEFTIEGHYIQMDSGHCTVTLEIYDEKNKKDIKVNYNLEQVGT